MTSLLGTLGQNIDAKGNENAREIISENKFYGMDQRGLYEEGSNPHGLFGVGDHVKKE